MKAGYRFSKDMKPVNHLLFMDDLKLYGANKDPLDLTYDVYSRVEMKRTSEFSDTLQRVNKNRTKHFP